MKKQFPKNKVIIDVKKGRIYAENIPPRATIIIVAMVLIFLLLIKTSV